MCCWQPPKNSTLNFLIISAQTKITRHFNEVGNRLNL
jgi:hypothetical protein